MTTASATVAATPTASTIDPSTQQFIAFYVDPVCGKGYSWL